MRIGRLTMLGLCSTAAFAADLPPPRIAVTGRASVSTPPDRATIGYTVRGEGATSDAAVAAMVAKRRRIDAGLAALARGLAPKASRVQVVEVRGRDCQQNYGAPRLATGECAIIGYQASIAVTLRTAAVKQAGTIVGLIGRLEGSNPQIDGFALGDTQAAQARAIAAALLDAQRQAEAIAAGTHVRLGRLISASNKGYGSEVEDVVVTGSQVPAPPPPPPPPPPIAVDLTPRPIETQAQVSVVYEAVP